MATWIAHLRIAEGLLARIPDLDPGSFAVGSIAPDSGVPDEKWEKFDPPPEVTHFKRNASVHKDIADLDFYRDYLADMDLHDRRRFSFRLGYLFHLITDNLWTIEIGKPTQERFSRQFAGDDQFIWEVKKDWYGLDHLYVRQHPECIFWREFLNAQADCAGLNFLPDKALSHQLAYIRSFYQRKDAEIDKMVNRTFIYLTQAEMDRFVQDAIQRLEGIFKRLWPVPPSLDGLFSSLDLPAS